jgi:hypothetical protein
MLPLSRVNDQSGHIMNGSEVRRFFHPPHSQDVALCDFWLFGTLKNKFEGNTFANEIEVKSKVSEILIDIPLHIFISIFDEWMSRLRECIDSGDEYLQSRQPTSFDLLPMEILSRDKTFRPSCIMKCWKRAVAINI